MPPARHPLSTYRLQFRPGFGFTDASDLLPYLDDLGVTDCYVSPILKPTPGSLHGYDICAHDRLNPELGSPAEFEGWCAALSRRGMGHIVDFVPNHMACDSVSNLWWRDVLENGPSSPFAKYFDIDWDPVKPELRGKVLLPLLGDQYGRVLERGELQLQFSDGALQLRYFDRDLPINPRQAPRVLGARLDDLQQQLEGQPALREYLSILTALQNLPAYTEEDAGRIVERQREKEVARERLMRLTRESAEIRQHIDAVVRLANGIAGHAASFDLLHTLLEHQAYRLAYWRTAFDEINYRRFFDINELAGLRMEDPDVFEATHALLRQMIASGQVTGLRIDHPDGLFDPAQYFDRLQQIARERRGPSADAGAPLYVVAEKILSEGESLRPDWAVAGTTGYSFLNTVAGLFVDGRNIQRLRRVYARLTGRQAGFADVAYESKRTILHTAMASELNMLAHALNRLSEHDRRHRDFTLNNCRTVLGEVIACFPVYRTYASDRGVDAFDRAAVSTAIGEARRRNPLMERSIFDFLEEALLTDVSVSAADDPDARERLRFAMKFQQFTGPVQAKGVEDTAFYRYLVLTAVNDVGGHPVRLSVSPAEFHDANVTRLRLWPGELITTATHDTKRGEDARMRIAVLSEIPDIWHRAVSLWMRVNRGHRTKLPRGWAPDRNDEYLFYQTLIGVWPPVVDDPSVAAGQAHADLVARVNAYMQKAIREAKVHTSWIDEDQAYTRAVTRFVDRTLTGETSVRFLRLFAPLQRRIAVRGMMNSLSQLVLKLGSPGVTDVYQGNELWDLSLVDPDNRRPVDFQHRRQVLQQLTPLIDLVASGGSRMEDVLDLFRSWEDGRIKLFVTACGLRFRRAHPALIRDGSYDPLSADGPAAEHVVAFGRRHASGELLVVVPRLLVSLVTDDALPMGEAVWTTTRIHLPDSYTARCYRHLLTGESVGVDEGPQGRSMRTADLYRNCPLGMLWAPSAA